MEHKALTQEQVKELFLYDNASGDLISLKKHSRGSSVGSTIAGCCGNHGYMVTTINGKQYLNHRLGCYASYEDAVCARLAGEQCLDWGECDNISPAKAYVKSMVC